MVDSYNFNFKISDNFWRDINKTFDLTAINGDNNTDREDYKLVLLSSMSTSFSNIVESDGYLKDNLDSISGVDVLVQPTITYFHLTCTFSGTGFSIAVNESVDIEFDDSDNNYVQAILLVKHETGLDENHGYVLAWAKASNPIRIKDAITIPLNSQICGVGNCNR